MLSLLSDIAQLALGFACIALGFFALIGTEANWAAKWLRGFIETNWAGSSAGSFRNLAIAALCLGAIIVGGILLSWIL